MNMVRHQYQEPRSDTPAEQEYAWLAELRVRGRAVLMDLVKGYGDKGGDVHIENAIRKIEDGCDDIWRRQCALEEAEG